ncbi:hypothetical protein [Microbacterium sp. PRC9]|uniref:hypothetical protein n=1 Tax=Microbacterium sp. PRC9 TaxID=2962591 RepID=UPI0028820B61|nr:hypothetical protein [Microbacterium sp. PRC9]MDT0144517.1 hypothetical protein [Microbacterium sp. PRC9]
MATNVVAAIAPSRRFDVVRVCSLICIILMTYTSLCDAAASAGVFERHADRLVPPRHRPQ